MSDTACSQTRIFFSVSVPPCKSISYTQVLYVYTLQFLSSGQITLKFVKRMFLWFTIFVRSNTIDENLISKVDLLLEL
jgi:hypothetical protein